MRLNQQIIRQGRMNEWMDGWLEQINNIKRIQSTYRLISCQTGLTGNSV